MVANAVFRAVRCLLRFSAISLAALPMCVSQTARGEEMSIEETEPERRSLFEDLANTWADWPQSQNFKITAEYRNYSYFEGESRGDSRDSLNEGRLRVEYDNSFRENMRVYIN
ncbi:MAG: hypothetical protein JSV16_02895, partial [Candidatus Hydrogenedentota bacterium]